MTEEKRKRGRPPGSGKKKEVTAETTSETISRQFRESMSPARLLTASSPTETPYPSNWDSLSKTDKLKFLTAQKAKK